MNLRKSCENCGEPVYGLGCTWCNEDAYIEEQEYPTSLAPEYDPPKAIRKFSDVVPALAEIHEKTQKQP